MTDRAGAADIELVLGRVVVGYRAVGAMWLAVLGTIAIVGSAPPVRPLVVVATMLGIGGWALITAWLFRSRRRLLLSWWWLSLDVAVTIWTLFSSDAAGMDASFYGGYPMSSVFMGVYIFAIIGGLSAAVALSAATVFRLIESAGSDPTNDSAAVLIYLFGAALAGWAVGVIRRADRLRHEAEQALVAERASRARAEERAEMAAHLHDSVLQTLAMIQRADQPEETAVLARRQERELRAWLFGGEDSPEESVAAAVRAMVGEVEETYAVPVQTVVVGDAPLTPALEALVNAGREAAVNAARHSGAEEISVYAEVGDSRVSLFVRDRGIGFDPAEVSSDRRGVTESIIGRMKRSGGRAEIRSAPGKGTEVILEQEVAG